MRKMMVILFAVMVGGVLGAGGYHLYTTSQAKATVTKGDSQVKKDAEPAKEAKPLSAQEIRVIMEKFHQIEETVSETVDSLQLVGDADADSQSILKEAKPKLTGLASEHYQAEKLPADIHSVLARSWEGGFYPLVFFDARMEIMENTPTKIRVKTFQLGDEAYLESANVYITAIKEKGTWVIDGYELVNVDQEPLNLTQGELVTYLGSRLAHNSSKGTVEYVSTGLLKGSEGFIVYYKEDSHFEAYLGKDGTQLYDIPAELIPSAYKLSQADAEKLVRESNGLTDDPDLVVEFDHMKDNGDYVFHAYSIYEGHIATVGWYSVNPITREISNEWDN